VAKLKAELEPYPDLYHAGYTRSALKEYAEANIVLALMVAKLKAELEPYPDLYHAGYTRSALKEYAEANIVLALITEDRLPDPDALGVDYIPYLGGLGEAAGELRRRILDIVRHGRQQEAEQLLEYMDEIYGLLVTIDFPTCGAQPIWCGE